MMKKRKYLLLSFAILLCQQAFPQQVNRAKLDSLFDILYKENKFMVSVALARNGQIIYTKATGIAAAEPAKIPATIHTRYRIGSITKTFTATMILQLVEEGKLTLATPLSKFFPQVPNANEITVAAMLTHHSGIHNFTDDAGYEGYMTEFKKPGEMVAIIAATKPDFQPNAKASYSNSNFVLLGYMIEKITGMSYAKNLEKRIVKKAGLTETGVGAKTDFSNNESLSFTYKNGWNALPVTDLSVPAGAGNLVSTPTDLTKFITALFSGKLLSPKSLDTMKTISDGFGMGLFQVPFEYRKGYGHNGSIDGFRSALFNFPEEGVVAAICSNGTSYSLNDILIAMLSAAFGKPFELPDFSTFEVTPAMLNQYVGTYSSGQLPLQITIAKDSTSLTAQATGQQKFRLHPGAEHVFRFDQAGIVMEFRPEMSEFTLKQNGGNFLFKREY